MSDEPTPPEADEIDEDLDDDEPEVEGFMEMPKLGGMGQIFTPIKPGGPVVVGPGPNEPTTIGGGTVKPGGTPGPVSFPGPS